MKGRGRGSETGSGKGGGRRGATGGEGDGRKRGGGIAGDGTAIPTPGKHQNSLELNLD